MILEHSHLQDAKSTPIPMNAGAILSTDQSPSTRNEINEMGDIPYQRGIGSLMYAATSTCPDIAFPIAILSQFMHNPGWIHWEAVKDVICYLKGMADLTLTLGGSAHGLEAYVDADCVRGHLSISLHYLLYSLLSPPTLSTPTPLCVYVHIITKGQRPLYPIVNDFAY
jgi:hypothetical protein